MNNLWIGVQQPSAAAKGYVAVIGAVLQILVITLNAASPFLHGDALTVVSAVIAVATVLAVYFVPNAAVKPQPGGYTNPWRSD